MKFWGILLLLFSLATAAAGCGAANQIKVGVIAGPHAEIMAVVRSVAEKNGLTVKVVEYKDYAKLNSALTSGEIDANCFQPLAYLESKRQDHLDGIVPAAKTIIYPMGLYSQNIKSIAEVKPGAVVAVPDDPLNSVRALLLLEKAGLLKLSPAAGSDGLARHISDNPRNIVIKEVSATRLGNVLGEVDLAAVSANYAIAAGLVPGRDSLICEDANSLYVNIIAVRTKDRNNPLIHKLVTAYQSNEVRQFILERYNGLAVPAW